MIGIAALNSDKWQSGPSQQFRFLQIQTIPYPNRAPANDSKAPPLFHMTMRKSKNASPRHCGCIDCELHKTIHVWAEFQVNKMPIISNDDHKVDRVFFAQTKRTKPRSKTASARFAERPILARILAHRATCSVAVAIVIVSAVLPFPCCTESKTWAVTVAAPQEDDPKAVLLEEVASNAQNAGDYEVAAAKWQELIDDYPEFERIGFALLESGKCNIELLQFENAIEHLKAANRQLPETAKV